MADDLRTRIKDTVWAFYNYDPSWHPDEWAEQLADAVITELGLRKVYRPQVRPSQPKQHRYVTHWERTDD